MWMHHILHVDVKCMCQMSSVGANVEHLHKKMLGDMFHPSIENKV